MLEESPLLKPYARRMGLFFACRPTSKPKNYRSCQEHVGETEFFLQNSVSQSPHRDQVNRVRLVLVGFSVVKRLTLWFFHQVMLASTYILAPEGRQVYRYVDSLNTEAPEGRHLDRAHEYVRKLFSYGRCNRHNQPVAPLGLGKVRFHYFYTPVGSLSQSLFVPLIPSGAKRLVRNPHPTNVFFKKALKH